MGRLLLALSLYVGLGSFFLVNTVALLTGASVFTAMTRGFLALVLFVALGAVAGLASGVKPQQPDETEALEVMSEE